MVAIVTGASGGIGRAISKALARDGYTVILNYFKNKAEAEKTAAEISADGGRAAVFMANISKESDVEKLFCEAEKYGPVDVLVNNAGVSHIGLLQDMTYDEITRVIGADFMGAVLCSKKAAQMMVKNKRGNIINISSVWGEYGASCEVLYSACKAGVIGLTKALAKELGPSGIRVNCVSPGVIDTKMNSSLSPETTVELAQSTPLSRIGSPEDVAEAVAFLVSEKASFITGQILPVNGGFIA